MTASATAPFTSLVCHAPAPNNNMWAEDAAGYKFTGDEFIEMLSCVQGFNLSWVVTDACDPFPRVEEESLG